MRRKRGWLVALLLLALLLAAPLLMNLEVFRAPVRRAVERQLGRPVEFATLSAQFLPWPGIVGRGVVVYEQEGFGAEPFLYADEVHCHLSLGMLRSGRLEFSEIYFIQPSINLVRASGGAWNVGTFLLAGQESGKTGNPAPARPPVVSATEGRINIKLGADKQIYALTDARLRAEPLPGGRWRLQLEATPMRSDRRLSETGTVRVQGEVGHGSTLASVPFRFQVGLERGSLSQLVALVAGHESWMRARSGLAATVEGTPADWKARGTLMITGLRHKDLVAPARTPRWQADFEVGFQEERHVLRIERLRLRGRRSELHLAGRVEDLFEKPGYDLQWRADLLSADELLGQWAALWAGVSTEARLDGALRLALTARGPLREWEGQLEAVETLALRAPGLPRPAELSNLRVFLRRGRLELAPATLGFSPDSVLRVEGDWRATTPGLPYRLRWQSSGLELEPLQKAAAVFGGDFLAPTRWRGRAQFDLTWQGRLGETPSPRWEGRAELRGAEFHPPEFNRPLDILEARLDWRGNRLRVEPLVVRLGENPVTGTLERQGEPGRWSATLSAGELRLAALDDLLNPAQRGLLARLGGEDSGPGARWDEMDVSGELKVEELTAGPFRLRQLQAQGRWEKGRLELSRLRFRAYGGRFDGRLQGDFRVSPPQYRLAGNVKQVELGSLLAETTKLGPLFRGPAGADLSLQTAGLGPDELVQNLQGRVVGVLHDGAITHFNLAAALASASAGEDLAGGAPAFTELQSLAGDFRLAGEQVELDAVRLIMDGAAMELSGRVRFDGSLDLRLSGEPLQVAGRPVSAGTARLLTSAYRLSGTLHRPQVEVDEPAPAEAPR